MGFKYLRINSRRGGQVTVLCFTPLYYPPTTICHRQSDSHLLLQVRLQEAGEEAYQEAEGRDHGDHREADTAEGQLQVCGPAGVRLRDEGCSLFR